MADYISRVVKSRRVYLIAIVVMLTSCEDPSPPDRFVDISEHVFYKLQLNHQAINLALVPPFDTAQLIAKPLNFFGNVLEGDYSVRIVSQTDRIVVHPNGVIQAMGQTNASGALVIATMTHNGVTLSDTVVVVATDIPRPQKLHSFSIQLPEGTKPETPLLHLLDITSLALPFRALDTAQLPIPRAIAHYEVDNPSILSSEGKAFTGLSKGKTFVYASAYIYGVQMMDSVEVTVTDRLVETLIVRTNIPMPKETTIHRGGGVFWINQTEDSLDIVFDDPDAVDAACCTLLGLMLGDGKGGDIMPFKRDLDKPLEIKTGLFFLPRIDPDIAKGRSFHTAGHYSYRSKKLPYISGTIVVK